MLRAIVPWLALAGLLACGANQPKVDVPTSEAATTGNDNPTRTPSSYPASRHASDDSSSKSGSGVARRSSEPPVAGDAVEITDFCAQHQIEANLKDIERCVSTPLGKNPNDQLWCSRRDELDDNRVAYYLALYRVQGKRLAMVFEFPYAAGPKPLAERENDFTYYVKLLPDPASDAQAFEIREEAELGCDEALKRVHDEFTVYPDIEKPVTELVKRVCATRGKYSANGQRSK